MNEEGRDNWAVGESGTKGEKKRRENKRKDGIIDALVVSVYLNALKECLD
jgi:hypothetical protein